MIKTLNQFLRRATDGEIQLSPDQVADFQERCKEAIIKQFSPRTKEPFKYRMSQIGRDLRLLQCKKLELEPDAPYPDNFCLKMCYGDLVEALVIVLLEASGVEVQGEQIPCELILEDELITGTLDIIIDDEVWDIKTASDYSYKFKFASFQSLYNSDDFGYVPQLYLYAEAMKLRAGGWIVINKSTGDIKMVRASRQHKVHSAVINQVRDNIIALRHTTSIDDIDRTLDLVDETFNRKPTGKKVLDSKHRFFDYKKVLWGDQLVYAENEASSAKVKPMNWYYIGDENETDTA